MQYRQITSIAVAIGISAFAFLAHAETWPEKPIRMVFPSAAGGGPERLIRAITGGLSQRLGQPVVIDYKPGAGGNIGAADIARSNPDGYSWMLAGETVFTINPLIYKNTGFKVEDTVPIAFFGSLAQTLACSPSLGVNSISDLVKLAQTKNLTYASTGPGSPAHLTMEMFLQATNVKLMHVPYRGIAPAIQDMLGDQVNCFFGVASATSELVKSRRLIGLAVSPKKRIDLLPDVATLQEQGIEGFDARFYLGIFAPRGVPEDIRSKFSRALEETLSSREVIDAMAANGVTPERFASDAAQRELREITTRWAEVVKRVDLKVE